ncbi:DUF268 domain-containing protein [Acidicapsa dinghuensis]|uniref:DUF268 domain-containing protein n=1 Tax=Acidicapsa dinghuensis TaxID=2218256 RepID=A0ABW1EJ42_9BACT|nr:DUF268 domain-containing protein [Acidicapsa dinghuensis]
MKFSLRHKQAYISGFRPGVFMRAFIRLPGYIRDIVQYGKMNPPRGFRISVASLFPILTDRDASAGIVQDHYFRQDLWAAQKIFERNPKKHVDIGSRIDGFIAHLLTFRSVTVIDIRSLECDIPGLTFVQDDATELNHVDNDSIDSMSSLHVAEHFGLGRYGDPIDPQACFRFMKTLQRVLSPGGRLYFSVPIGRERVEFNAHRIFAPLTVLQNFTGLKLVSFSFIGDDGLLHSDANPLAIPESDYACGLFEFTKPDND